MITSGWCIFVLDLHRSRTVRSSSYYYSPSRRNDCSAIAANLHGTSFWNLSMLLQKPSRRADRTLTLTLTMTLKWRASKVKKNIHVFSTFLIWKSRYSSDFFTQCAKYKISSFVFYMLIKKVDFSWRPSWKHVFKIANFLTRADINSVSVSTPPPGVQEFRRVFGFIVSLTVTEI